MNGRKRHLLVDTDGRLLQVLVHPANIAERGGARMLLEDLRFPDGRLKLMWADAGYSGLEFAQWVEQRHGVKVEIVSKRQQTGFKVLARRVPSGQGSSSEPSAGGTNGGA